MIIPPLPIIPIHEGSWSGDDSADHTDDQHHDSGSPDHTNEHSLDSNIPAGNYVGHIDHDYHSPNWSSDYEDQIAHSFSDGGWENNDFDSSSSWGNSFDATSANDEADTHLDSDNDLEDLEDFDDSAYINPTEQLLGITSQRLSYSRRRKYYLYPVYSDSGVYADGDDDSSSSNFDCPSSDDYASSSCTDSDGDGFCDDD